MNGLVNHSIKYFGYGTNRAHDMMTTMIGREDINGVKAVLPGYELVVQKLEHFSDQILQTAPIPRSPREIMQTSLGEGAKLYIIRPNPKGVTYGTIWDISDLEYEMVRDWELLDFGMQEDIKAEAQTELGEHIIIQTHGSTNPALPMDIIVEGDDYEDYLLSREAILNAARRVHREFLERMSNRS